VDDGMTTAAHWRESFPEIPWDEPIEVTVLRSNGYELNVLACRICIADVGLKAQDIIHGVEGLAVFEKPDDFIEHLAVTHGG
jgi:hypothetical protein